MIFTYDCRLLHMFEASTVVSIQQILMPNRDGATLSKHDGLVLLACVEAWARSSSGPWLLKVYTVYIYIIIHIIIHIIMCILFYNSTLILWSSDEL